jgi:glycosyltransferase involved in cell wall biosynthesis
LFKILYVEEAPSVGGSSFSLLQLTSSLDCARYEPCVLFRYDLPVRRAFASLGVRTVAWESITGAPSAPPPDAPPGTLPAYKLTAPYRFLWSAKAYLTRQRADSITLARWLERERFSLLHANNSVSANLGAIVAASRARVPAISHQRGYFRLTPAHRWLSRAVERFVCVSDAVRRHYVGEGLAPDKVQTIYNGIDVRRLKPRPKVRRDYVLIGWFGRFERWKGATTFVEAARLVRSKATNVRFLMVGTGPEEEAIRRTVEGDRSLAAGVELTGFRSDAIELLAGCDVLVNSSIEPEPLSRSALEALACGVPVVASDSGGNPEIVGPKNTGLLFRTGDASSLAAALDRLVENGAMRERLSAEARQRAETLFNAEQYVGAVSALYAAALEGRG